MTDTRAKNAMIEKAHSEIDQLWAIEAEVRLAAYHRGEIKALELTDILSACDWHGEALRDAALKYSTGHTKFIDWESAKKHLQGRT